MVGTFCATCTATDFRCINFGFFPESEHLTGTSYSLAQQQVILVMT